MSADSTLGILTANLSDQLLLMALLLKAVEVQELQIVKPHDLGLARL